MEQFSENSRTDSKLCLMTLCHQSCVPLDNSSQFPTQRPLPRPFRLLSSFPAGLNFPSVLDHVVLVSER